MNTPRRPILLLDGARKRSRRVLLIVVVAVSLCAQVNVAAQNVIIVVSGDAKPYKAAQSSLTTRLESLGMTSRTVMLSSLSGGDPGASLSDKDVDVYVAVGTPATLWLYQRLDPEIRLISCMVTEKIAGEVDGHRGMIVLDMKLSPANQFKLLQEALPEARRIGMLYSSHNSSSVDLFKAAQAAAPPGSEIIGTNVDAHRSKADAIKALFRRHLDVVWADADSAVYDIAVVRALLLEALKKNTPVFGFSLGFVRSGALIGVGVDPEAQGRAAANTIKEMFDRQPAFTGIDSSAVVVLEAKDSDLAVNLLVADQIGVNIPRGLIAHATHIFK